MSSKGSARKNVVESLKLRKNGLFKFSLLFSAVFSASLGISSAETIDSLIVVDSSDANSYQSSWNSEDVLTFSGSNGLIWVKGPELDLSSIDLQSSNDASINLQIGGDSLGYSNKQNSSDGGKLTVNSIIGKGKVVLIGDVSQTTLLRLKNTDSSGRSVFVDVYAQGRENGATCGFIFDADGAGEGGTVNFTGPQFFLHRGVLLGNKEKTSFNFNSGKGKFEITQNHDIQGEAAVTAYDFTVTNERALDKNISNVMIDFLINESSIDVENCFTLRGSSNATALQVINSDPIGIKAKEFVIETTDSSNNV